jgi:hypothetical protein
MSREQLLRLGSKTVAVTLARCGTFSFVGVPVFDILQAAGYQLDQPRRGAFLTQYVVFVGHDGYRVV